MEIINKLRSLAFFSFLACTLLSEACCEGSRPVCGKKFGFNLDVLYLRAFDRELGCGCGPTFITDVVNSTLTTSTIADIDIDPKFSWKPGFRLGGYYAILPQYQLEVSWMHEQTFARGDEDRSRLRWKLKYDTLDATLARVVVLDCNILVKPFVGIRVARVEDKLGTDFVSTLSTATLITTTTTQTSNRNKFIGAGPIGGLEVELPIFKSLSIYGKAAASTVFGRERNRFVQNVTSPTLVSIQESTTRRFANDIFFDGAVGVKWQTAVTKSIGAAVKVGWEDHRFFERHLDGPFVSAEVDF